MATTEIDIYDGDDEDVIPSTATVATCQDITPAVYSGVIFTCSECGAITYLTDEGEESTVCGGELNFCPNCGRMVVE